jgi:hypothetical protein
MNDTGKLKREVGATVPPIRPGPAANLHRK